MRNPVHDSAVLLVLPVLASAVTAVAALLPVRRPESLSPTSMVAENCECTHDPQNTGIHNGCVCTVDWTNLEYMIGNCWEGCDAPDPECGFTATATFSGGTGCSGSKQFMVYAGCWASAEQEKRAPLSAGTLSIHVQCNECQEQ